MCDLHAYDNKNDKSTDATNFGGGIPIPDDSTKISLVSIFSVINFISFSECPLAKIFTWSCCAYQENIKEIFKQISTEIPKPTPEDFKKKRQTLLTDIGG